MEHLLLEIVSYSHGQSIIVYKEVARNDIVIVTN